MTNNIINLIFLTFVFGVITDVISEKQVDKNIALAIIGQWLVTSGVVYWGMLPLGGAAAIFGSLATSQIVRPVRRLAVCILERRDRVERRRRVQAAAAPYLERYGRR